MFLIKYWFFALSQFYSIFNLSPLGNYFIFILLSYIVSKFQWYILFQHTNTIVFKWISSSKFYFIPLFLMFSIYLFLSPYSSSYLNLTHTLSIVHTAPTVSIQMLLWQFRLICLVIIIFTMYLDTVKELQKWQDEAEQWKP